MRLELATGDKALRPCGKKIICASGICLLDEAAAESPGSEAEHCRNYGKLNVL